MKNALKYGLFALAAYELYQHFFSGVTAPASNTPAAGTNAGASPAGTTTTTPPASTTTAATTRQMLLTATANAQTLSYHQWNYFYQALRGQAGPAPEDVGQGDGSRLITVDEYLAAIAQKGLA